MNDALARAEHATATRPLPAITYGQMQHLLKRAEIADRRARRGTALKSASRTELARRVGAQIGVSGRTVERYRDNKIKTATGVHGRRLKAVVEKTWQPKVKDAARARAATQSGITVETRARFGFTAAPGSTDDGRIRLVTHHLPPTYADRLFQARQTGATEEDLKNIVALGLQEQYFKDNGRRAHGLTVEFIDIDYLDLDY
ncbi:telomere-protecting terminal protein Tpg [Streptomyces sp. NPDC054887]